MDFCVSDMIALDVEQKKKKEEEEEEEKKEKVK